MRGRAPLLAAAALVAAGCASAPKAPPAPPSAPAGRPNIVLILTDDMDLSHVQYMPSLRTLAARGLSFSNMFVVNPVCGPSRASLLTGQYSHNHGFLTNKPPRGSFRKFFAEGREASTIATWLHDAGYRTGLVGKYVNFYPMKQRNPTYVPPGWDDWRGAFFPESYYDYEINENGRIVAYAKAEEDYQTDVLRRKALDFVDETPASQPFYLHLSPFAPHGPSAPADRHDALFPDILAPRPPSHDEEDVSDKPAWVRSLPRITPEVQQGTDAWFRNRVRSLQAVDEMIAALLGKLESRGLLRNTYVFFTSDNGFHFGEHRLDHGKGDAYEESIRVPLIVAGPGVPAGKTVEELVLNIDLAPTFAALGGAAAPDSVDGRSLARILQGRPTQRQWRTDFLIEQYSGGQGQGEGQGEGGEITEYSALRSAENLYVEYETGERELYDLRKDPYQLQSLHATAEPELLSRLSQRLAALKACRGESCRQ